MFKISTCQEHQYQIQAFCYTKNCKIGNRLLCNQCVSDQKHKNHSYTNIDLEQKNSPLNNLSRYSKQQDIGELIIECLKVIYELYQKPFQIVSLLDKQKKQIQQIFNKIRQYAFQSLKIQSAVRAKAIIFEQSNTQNHQTLAQKISSMNQPHITNRKYFENALKINKFQIQKGIKLYINPAIQNLKKFSQHCQFWSIFNDKNWVEIIQNHQISKNQFIINTPSLNVHNQAHEDYVNELNQFVNFAINQKYKPIGKWIVTGHKIEDIQELKLWGDNFGDKIFEKTIGGSNIRKIPKLNVLTKLKRLELTFNFIERIENIDKLTSLTLLALANNHITKIQNLDTLTSLKILGLGNNRIQRIENIDKLQSLSVCFLLNNNIEKIENLQNLRELTQLYLNGNKISKIQNLNKLKSLSKLYLSDNQIKRVQNLTGLNKLGMIELQNNPLIKDDLNVNEILYLKEQNTHVKHSLN